MDFINPLDNTTINTSPLETGPFNIQVLETDTGDRELHLSFKEKFRASSVQQRSESMQSYINYLTDEILLLEESDQTRQGMINILQICEQLQPHIHTDELQLEETIVGSFQSNDPFANIKIV